MKQPQSMYTNHVFHHLLRLMQIHKDKDLIVEMFKKAGVSDISRSKIASWDAKSRSAKNYREMPAATLELFIDQLYKERLIEDGDNHE